MKEVNKKAGEKQKRMKEGVEQDWGWEQETVRKWKVEALEKGFN